MSKMIRFKQFIAEAFDSSYPIIKQKSSPKLMSFTFNDKDNIEYEVDFIRYENRKSHNINIEFSAIVNGKGSMKQTNTSSNALKIYSTVGKMLEQYINKNPVSVVHFSAAIPETHDVYDGLAKIIARKLGGKVSKPYSSTWEIQL